MTIRFSCSICAEEYRLKDEFAGKRVRCRLCGEKISVPEPKRDDGNGEREGRSSTALDAAPQHRASRVGNGTGSDGGGSRGVKPPALRRSDKSGLSAEEMNWFEPSAQHGWKFVSLVAVCVWVFCYAMAFADSATRPMMMLVLYGTGLVFVGLGWIGAMMNAAREHWGYALLNLIVPLYHIVYNAFRAYRIPTFVACEVLAFASYLLAFVLVSIHVAEENAKRRGPGRQVHVTQPPTVQRLFAEHAGSNLGVPSQLAVANGLVGLPPLLKQERGNDWIGSPPIGKQGRSNDHPTETNAVEAANQLSGSLQRQLHESIGLRIT
jgi:DNA-directed RNA polymerase subunit RPC12/RpoP